MNGTACTGYMFQGGLCIATPRDEGSKACESSTASAMGQGRPDIEPRGHGPRALDRVTCEDGVMGVVRAAGGLGSSRKNRTLPFRLRFCGLPVTVQKTMGGG